MSIGSPNPEILINAWIKSERETWLQVHWSCSSAAAIAFTGVLDKSSSTADVVLVVNEVPPLKGVASLSLLKEKGAEVTALEGARLRVQYGADVVVEVRQVHAPGASVV